MTRHHNIERRFTERDRERLVKLFRALGSNNTHEAETARGRIDSLLQQFGKSWNDLIELLGGTPAAVHADIVRDIIALGSSDPARYARARRNLEELLLRHRKSWNDLTDELYSISPASWVSGIPKPPPDPAPGFHMSGSRLFYLEECAPFPHNPDRRTTKYCTLK